MSRTYAPLLTEIWQDKAFTSLSVEAQRLYLLINSQPDITYCGVVIYNERRWAKWARNSSSESIYAALLELVTSRFVLFDEDTDEVWVRSFIKHNNVRKQPNIFKAAMGRLATIHSAEIHDLVEQQLCPTHETDDSEEALVETPSLGLPLPQANPSLTLPVTPGLRSNDHPEPKPEHLTQTSSSSPALTLVRDDEEVLDAVFSELTDRRYLYRVTSMGKMPFAIKEWRAATNANEREKYEPDLREFLRVNSEASRDPVLLADLAEDGLLEALGNPVRELQPADELSEDDEAQLIIDLGINRKFINAMLRDVWPIDNPVQYVLDCWSAQKGAS